MTYLVTNGMCRLIISKLLRDEVTRLIISLSKNLWRRIEQAPYFVRENEVPLHVTNGW
jgi:hypothetical protein